VTHGGKNNKPEIRKLRVNLMSRVAYPVLFSKWSEKAAGYKVFLGVQLTKNSRRKHSCLPTEDYVGLLLSRAQKGSHSDLKPCCHTLCSGKWWKCINQLEFPPPAGRRATRSRELNMVSAQHCDCAMD